MSNHYQPDLKKSTQVSDLKLRYRLTKYIALLIALSFLGLSSCEKWDDPDCVRCRKEWDPEVNFVYNLMSTELCNSNSAALQTEIDQYEARGYDCDEIE